MEYIPADTLRARIESLIKNERIQLEADKTNGEIRKKSIEHYQGLLGLIDTSAKEFEEQEFQFKGGSFKVNGKEHHFTGGKARIIILDITPE